MKERPILFQGAMVRALLAGMKTQTRRAIAGLDDLPPAASPGQVLVAAGDDRVSVSFGWPIDKHTSGATGGVKCPYGQPGDRLWVREAWRAPGGYDRTAPRDIDVGAPLHFEADGDGRSLWGKLRPPMFMPRWACRIVLEVTDVRVERLQAISEADAKAEGAEALGVPMRDGQHSSQGVSHWNGYVALWESINGPGSWDANPWVWAVSFKRVLR